MKDMCTIEHLPELMEAGIDSFKIEGRMKKPEYAAGVTAIYRKYMDRYPACSKRPFSVEKQDLNALSGLYIRSERQDGYYFKQNGPEMVTVDSPSYSGSDEAYLGQLRQKYIEEKKRIGVWMKAVFVCGEQALIRMGTGRLCVEVCGSLVEPAQNRPVLEEDIRRQLQKLGESCFVLEDLEIRTDGKGFYSLKEINALRREAVRRLEDQIIAGHGLTVRRNPELTSPLSPAENAAVLKASGEHSMSETALKKDALVEDILIEDTLIEDTLAEHMAAGKAQPGCDGLRIHISTKEQLLYLAEHFAAVQKDGKKQGSGLNIKRLYAESHLLLGAWPIIQPGDKAESGDGRAGQALRSLQAEGIALWIALPYILRSKDEEILKQALELYRQGRIQGFLVRNLEEYGWLEQRTELKPRSIQLDHTIYVWNSRTADFWQRKDCGLTCPLELNGREWRQLLEQIGKKGGDIPEKLIYGRIPVMVTANCIAKTAGKCLRGQPARSEGIRAEALLTDRYQKKFPVELCCDVCMNVIYNSVPLSLHREWERCGNVYKRLSFTTESGEEMGRIVAFFANSAGMSQQKPPYGDYTTGHEKRGVL